MMDTQLTKRVSLSSKKKKKHNLSHPAYDIHIIKAPRHGILIHLSEIIRLWKHGLLNFASSVLNTGVQWKAPKVVNDAQESENAHTSQKQFYQGSSFEASKEKDFCTLK